MSTPSPTPSPSPSPSPDPQQPRDAAYWARQGTHLKVSVVPAGAVNLNVDGRNVVGPMQGFGQMWQKTYRVRLEGATATPVEVIQTWKSDFSSFWPRGNRFYAPLTGIAPGEVALLNIKAGGMPLSTGVMVLYADDESFTLMTPEGHVFAGWITFSSFEDDGYINAQTQVLMRANDPIYEIGLRFLGGHRQEDGFWKHTLTAVAARFGVTDQPVFIQKICVDPHLQWRHANNVWKNATMRTVLTAPTRWFRRGGRA